MAVDVGNTVELAHRSWPTIERQSLVLVPTGSTEQHGPHLPFSTDSIIAERVALGVAEWHRRAIPTQSVVVAPTLTFGASGEHQTFAGTVSIGHEALRQVLVEMVRSLSTWAGRIVFINAHGGNVPSLIEATIQLLAEQHDVAWAPCQSPGGDAHAGRTETSILLHLAPGLVNMPAAVVGNILPIGKLMGELSTVGVRGVSASGILGDPSQASAEEGRNLVESLIANVSRRIVFASADQRGMLQTSRVARQIGEQGSAAA